MREDEGRLIITTPALALRRLRERLRSHVPEGVSVVDELIVHGSADHCREMVEQYVANGVTTPAPAVVPFGDPQAAYRALAPR